MRHLFPEWELPGKKLHTGKKSWKICIFHMMKAVIHTEISPIVGTEKQSEDLVQSLLADFADDPVQLWESNIFGKSLHELVNDGLQNKLLHIPQEARTRLQETLERVINEGCTGLICILI